jgi:2-hydroxychromene-2-carboxylate isomerase
MLTVYINFKSPASYLAIKPVLALVERHGIVLEWKAFRSSEREVPTITDNPLVANMH